MAKQIYCELCGKYLGELANGTKIMKGIVYLCPKCYQRIFPKTEDCDVVRDLLSFFDK